MNQPVKREVTADMIDGNLLTQECVMAAVFVAGALVSVSLRVVEAVETA